MASQGILTDAIIKLWNEAHNPLYIAYKLGITDENGEPDTEKVEAIIEDKNNYPSWREYRRVVTLQ